MEFASKFIYKTPTSVIYENVKKLKGTQCRKISILKDYDQYATNEEIANKLGKTFSDISNDRNYTTAFQKIKEQQERTPIKSIPNREHEYNRNFQE